MSKQQTSEEVDIFTKLTVGKKRFDKPKNINITIKQGITSNVETLGIPTSEMSEGCQISDIQILPELSMNNQPSLAEITRIVTPLEKNKLLSIIKEEESELPQLIIEGVMISNWSYDEIKKQSVATLTSVEDYGINTINDPRLGTVKSNVLCSSCVKDNIECSGHFGDIDLDGNPVYNPLDYKFIIKVLNSVCNSCGDLLLTREVIEELGIDKYSGDEKLSMIEKASDKRPCSRNNSVAVSCPIEGLNDIGEIGELRPCIPNPEYLSKRSKDLGKIMYRCYGDKSKEEYERPIEKVMQIFDAIGEDDIKLLGFENDAHPLNMIMRAILVIPPCNRSNNIRDGMIGSDPIGTIYKDIIRVNEALKINHNESDRILLMEKLIFYISHLINNTDGAYGRGKAPFKSIRQLIQGKKSAVRGALMGKRVDFSARTVIGPDPSLKFWQIGLPQIWRSFLTRPITTTNFNKESLTESLKKGEITHVTLSTGKLKNTRIKVNENIKKNLSLQPGDKVDRWAQEGDWIIANRQPTLHKQGMMGHEVLFHSDLTVKLPLSVVGAYNADFDGDEMNIHMVQTDTAMIEVMTKMNVIDCIMNAQTNSPIMGPHMDALTGAYMLTQPDVYVDQETFYDCMMIIIAQDDLPTLSKRLKRHNIPDFSGKALFSCLLPGDLYYQKGDVIIIDGILISGVISKDTVGKAHNSLVQELWKRYGKMRTAEFITDVTKVMDRWLIEVGFSVGLKDCYPLSKEHKKVIKEEVARSKLLATQFGLKLQDPFEEERREKEIIGQLNRTKDIGGRISKENLQPDNALNIMALSGGKGSTYNISQITTMLGQQFLEGKRMPETISGGTRALPYFEQNELDPEARGNITESFVEGLRPSGVFFHAVGGREGLIDTGVKTAEVGFLHRLIFKSLEDLMVHHDGSVRDSTGSIIQSVYGEDGFNAAELQFIPFEENKIPFFINLDQVSKQINAKYGYY